MAKGSFQIPVVPDLGLQHLRGLLHGRDGGQHLCQMLLQQVAPLRGGCIPLAAQPREGLHLPDGHAGFAQAQQESDPFHVRRRVAPLAAGRTRHGGNQACALVVTQRVDGQASACSDVGDGQKGCHGRNSESWSAL